MQQTSKYQFKLIEGTDDFSPGPLNDNMEMVDHLPFPGGVIGGHVQGQAGGFGPHGHAGTPLVSV